ncbi:hypothetical protein RCS94_00530 [Orbaceae bacterium ac157xtp]
MKKLTLATLSAFTIVMLSGCGSHSAKTDSELVTEFSAQSGSKLANGLGQVQSEQYKLVVMPTKVNIANQSTFPLSSDALTETLTHEITTALYQSHRFYILALDENNSENNYNEQKTDFYLTSTLNQLDKRETVRILKATGQGVEEKTISTSILYQLIDAKSNKVAFSHTLNYQLKSTVFSEQLSTTINNTLKSLARMMKTEILNEIYPIRVIGMVDNQFVLDQPLPVGAYCNVNHLGVKVNDIYTDSLLGYEQKMVGKLLITHTSGVMAYADLVEGQVTKGDICKPVAKDAQSAPELIKRTTQGGVVLPFD